MVVRIAGNPLYFRYLSECAPDAEIVLGDARLKLGSAPDSHYGLIVLDAFSGDSIPMHLVTREALAVYEHKLAPHGILAFYISNGYMDLTRTLGLLAQDAHLACLVENDTSSPQAVFDPHWSPSTWVVMTRNADDLRALISSPDSRGRWLPISTSGKQSVWTDDYSNLLSIMRLR